MLPESFGKYKVVRLLGRGGMATVYEGHDTLLDRKVAIKTIHPHLIDDEKFVRRFRREAKLLASLRHPHIVRFLDFDQYGAHMCLVMEYLEGGSLSNRLATLRSRNELLPKTELFQILNAVASALDYAHRHGMIHRDIKPANILFAADGTPVVTDFGITKSLFESLSISATGSILGTPTYMSPEQASSTDVTASTDIYSLGIVVYEFVTGKVPFQGATATEVLLKHIQQEPPEPQIFNPQIPKSAQDVILKALEKDPAKRYSTATEFAQAFYNAYGTGIQIQNIPIQEKKPETGPKELQLAELPTEVDAALLPPRVQQPEQKPVQQSEKKPPAQVYKPPPLPQFFKSIRLPGSKRQPAPPVQVASPPARQDTTRQRKTVLIVISISILSVILICVFFSFLPQILEYLERGSQASLPVYSFAPKVTLTPGSYTWVGDSTNKLSVPVPIEWDEVDPKAAMLNPDVITASEQLVAAPSIQSFLVPGEGSGMMIATIDNSSSLEETLDKFKEPLGYYCTWKGRNSFPRSGFTGFYDTYVNCGTLQSTQLILAAQEKNAGAPQVLIIVQALSDLDFLAAEKIFNEFKVNYSE